MEHDPEAIRTIVTTLRTLERSQEEGKLDAEELADAILMALQAEGMRVIRTKV